MKNCQKTIFMPAVAVAALAASTAVSAQDKTAGGDTLVLEEIIVSATKTEKNMQDLGQVINSFSGAQLRERNVDQIHEVVSLVPGVNILEATGGGVPVIFIRGVGLADFRVNNTPAAAVYVDEIYKPSVAQIGATMFDLERIEILKGPQGGLYGRNTTAGAVQIISARPKLGETGGYATLGYGQWDRIESEAAVNAALGDAAAFRLSGRLVNSGPAFQTSIADSAAADRLGPTGGDHGREDQWSLRAQFYAEVGEVFDILVKVHGGRDQTETALLRPIGLWNPNAGDIGPDTLPGPFSFASLLGDACDSLLQGRRDPNSCTTLTGQTPAALGLNGDNPYETTSSNFNRLDNEFLGATAIMNADLSDSVTLSSITGYETFDHDRDTDWDAKALAYQDIAYASEIEAFSQELRLAYISDSLQAIGGVNYSRETLDEDTLLFATRGLVPLAFGFNEVVQRYEQSVDSYAVFGRVDYQPAEQWNMVLELRHTWEDKSFSGATTLRSAPGSGDTTTEFPFVDPSQPAASFADFTGKAAIEYKPSEDAFLYASISRGFKSGGFPGGIVLSNESAEVYDPEILWSYEVGVKAEALNSRMRVNAAAFYYDYSSLQGSAVIDAGNGVFISRFQNIGDAEIYGFDLDASYLVTENLFVQALVSYVSTEITTNTATQVSFLGNGDEFNLQGQSLNYTPEWSTVLLARYTNELMDTGLEYFIQADYDWRSSQNFSFIGSAAERAIFREGAYGLFNLQLGLTSPDNSWSISAFVKNLTDELYRTNAAGDSLGGAYEIFGMPRSWGVVLGYNF